MNIEKRKINIWGDSILKGIVLDESSDRYHVLEKNCVKRFSSKTGASVVNNASFGMTTQKAVERIGRSIKRRPPEKNDIVLIEFGGNDCDFFWDQISKSPDKSHEPKTPLDSFVKNIYSIIEMFKSLYISPVFMSLPPLEPNRYFEWISRNLDAANILKWLGDVNKIYRWQEAYSNTLVEIAIKNNLRVIDVRKGFLISDNYTSLICEDGIHPNQNGHETIYKSFVDYVQAV
ncbi:MAG TPA: SGNH/GDSL hydrolase family protein [Treponemataceae bacterium]|nr:SGNH/GDSL hydrolase family protein [Treponemataceae bacterium]